MPVPYQQVQLPYFLHHFCRFPEQLRQLLQPIHKEKETINVTLTDGTESSIILPLA